jgi:hypothetical protein
MRKISRFLTKTATFTFYPLWLAQVKIDLVCPMRPNNLRVQTITRLLPPFSKIKVKIEENIHEDAVLSNPGQRRSNLETDS